MQKITVWDDLGARTWVYAYNEQGQPTEIVEQLNGQPVGRMTIDYDADGMIAKVVLDGTLGQRTVTFQETNPILHKKSPSEWMGLFLFYLCSSALIWLSPSTMMPLARSSWVVMPSPGTRVWEKLPS